MFLTLRNPQVSDIGFLLMGLAVRGRDPVGKIYIHVVQLSDLELTVDVGSSKELVVDTGVTETNYWLRFVRNAASQAKLSNCVVCAEARPVLTMPSPLSNASTFFCLLQLHITENPSVQCKYLEHFFPMSSRTDVPPVFKAVEGSFTCLARRRRQRSIDVGRLNVTWCKQVIDVSLWENATMLNVSRSDVFWYCGNNRLLKVLPAGWSGLCAEVSLVSPVRFVNITIDELQEHRALLDKQVLNLNWVKREFDIYASSPVYIDAIGVPTEFKLIYQVAAGFESILPWIILNKNVDRINFIHFSLQSLNNLTRDALQIAHEQLAATSLMAYQNCIALDYLLAEQGGVCSFFGSACTFIPGNTETDGL
ncbi:uncharacterized protein LOC106515710, partial [Austrofundulus limnaeus]|uniref:Uncharacterized protein LOC106515710 n=1 Tax=Austrofundulus limnaeus TaxID=52670 RepID=A0A2I4B007_AUSLI